MNFRSSFLLMGLGLLFFSLSLKAQNNFFNNKGLPFKSLESPAFGQDIVIHDSPDQDQMSIAICSAFNGWLYAAYSYPFENNGYLSILRSTDHGYNWDLLYNEWYTCENTIISKMNILAAGTTISNLKVFVSFIMLDTLLTLGNGTALRFNSDLVPEKELLQQDCSYMGDVTLASDYLFPSANANPFSVAIVNTKQSEIVGTDSVVFRLSTDGGMNFNIRRALKVEIHRWLNKVSVAYGYSASKNTGRYYVAWEDFQNESSKMGHIYTSHTEPDIISPFTNPISIDSLDPSTINKVRNPSIACQMGNYDSDSLNITESILFEKNLQGSTQWDISGYSNLQSTQCNYFQPLSFTNHTKKNMQPYICFNPYDSAFMVTYFDSTSKKLPFLVNNYNLKYPNSWENVSFGYNDNSNIAKPKPQIAYDSYMQRGMNVWTGKNTFGNGIALFDYPESTYNGFAEKHKVEMPLTIFPNPCSNYSTISFFLKKDMNVKITISDLTGQSIKVISNKPYKAGENHVKADLTDFPPGCYLCTVSTDELFTSKKLILIR